MFKSISWQEYFSTIGILIGGYYTISILLLYSREFVLKFNSSKKEAVESRTESINNLSESLMGPVQVSQPKPAESSQPTILPSERIFVVPNSGQNSTDQESSDALLVTTVSDLLQEIKTLSNNISQNNGSKDESIFMFQSLLRNYSHLSSTKYRGAINVFLYQECKSNFSFEIELAEIETWWSSESQDS